MLIATRPLHAGEALTISYNVLEPFEIERRRRHPEWYFWDERWSFRLRVCCTRMSGKDRSLRCSRSRVLSAEGPRPWWDGMALDSGAGRLAIGGVDIDSLVREHGTPLYVYDRVQIRSRVAALRNAMEARGLRWRIYYAMKANRFRPVLDVLRETGVGISACSPRECALALAAGFTSADISVTASCLTNGDIAEFVRLGCHVNLDTLSAIRRYASLAPRGARIGLRIDTGTLAGYGINSKTADRRPASSASRWTLSMRPFTWPRCRWRSIRCTRIWVGGCAPPTKPLCAMRSGYSPNSRCERPTFARSMSEVACVDGCRKQTRRSHQRVGYARWSRHSRRWTRCRSRASPARSSLPTRAR